MKISAYVIAFNEEVKIQDCVQTLLWADEIIVADSGSTDETASIAESLGAKVVQIPFCGFGALRNSAIAHCTGEWIFSLDADERCTEAVRDEVVAIANDSASVDIYRVPRRNYFLGQWIKYSGWYPNFRQPQLFRQGKMSYGLEQVHESFVSHSDHGIGQLTTSVWQVPFKNFSEVIEKENRYSSLGVARLESKGQTGSFGKALGHGLWSFFKHYILKRGFLDGWAGFVIAFFNFHGTFYRYAKLTEQQANWELPKSEAVEKVE